MKKKSVLFLLAVCCLLYFSSHSQTVYSTWPSNPGSHVSTARTPSGLVCLGGPLTCPQFNNVNNTTDMDLDNYATISFPVLSVFSSATITMDLSSTVSTGYRGGVFMRSRTSLVGAEVLPSITITLLNGSTPVASESYGEFLDLNLFESSGLFVCVEPNVGDAYNKVQLKIDVPIGVNLSLEFDVYYAFGNNEAQCHNGMLPSGSGVFQLKSNDQCDVEINWSAEQEKSNGYYTIQKLSEGHKEWKDIHTQHQSEGVSTGYSYIDRNNYSGRSYYRIIRHTYTGQKHIYAARAITLNCSRTPVSVYPTIAKNSIVVELPDRDYPSRVDVISSSGKIYKSKNVALTNRVTIDVSDLPPGLYLLRIEQAGLRETRKLVIPPR